MPVLVPDFQMGLLVPVTYIPLQVQDQHEMTDDQTFVESFTYTERTLSLV